MKVFISWSGKRSNAVANLLNVFLRNVIQAVDPWMSSNDIEPGVPWFSELSSKLKASKLGIVCLTPENKDNPWILFEAGALVNGLDNLGACTFLVELKSTDLLGPLGQFQHTSSERNEVLKLVKKINSLLLERSLSNERLEKSFEKFWPDFKEELKTVLEGNAKRELVEERTERDILEEVLEAVRRIERGPRFTTHGAFRRSQRLNIRKLVRALVKEGHDDAQVQAILAPLGLATPNLTALLAQVRVLTEVKDEEEVFDIPEFDDEPDTL